MVKYTYRWCTCTWLPGTFWGWRSTAWRCWSSDRWRAACSLTCRSTVDSRRPARPWNIPGSVGPPASVQTQVPPPRIVRVSSGRTENSASRWRHFRYSEARKLHRCNTQRLHFLSILTAESFTVAILSSNVICTKGIEFLPNMTTLMSCDGQLVSTTAVRL